MASLDQKKSQNNFPIGKSSIIIDRETGRAIKPRLGFFEVRNPELIS